MEYNIIVILILLSILGLYIYDIFVLRKEKPEIKTIIKKKKKQKFNDNNSLDDLVSILK